MSLSLVVWSFLMSQCWSEASERNIKEVMPRSPHCIPTGGPRFWFVPLLVVSIFITWLKWCLPVLSIMKSFFFLSVINTFLWERNLRLCKYPVPYQTSDFFHFFISRYIDRFLFYPMGYISLLILMFKLSQVWPVGAPSSRILCSLDMSPYFWALLFGFYGHKMSRFIFYFHCPSMEINESCKELRFLTETKMLSVLLATGVRLLPNPSSEKSWDVCMCV